MTHIPIGRSILRETRASYAFVERNFNMVKRYWGWEVVWLIYSLVNALSITFIGKATPAITGQALSQTVINQTILYLLIGTLVWHYLSLVFDSIAEAVQWERWEGTIEYTFMAPVSRLTHLVGTTLFAVFYGLLFTVGPLLWFGYHRVAGALVRPSFTANETLGLAIAGLVVPALVVAAAIFVHDAATRLAQERSARPVPAGGRGDPLQHQVRALRIFTADGVPPLHAQRAFGHGQCHVDAPMGCLGSLRRRAGRRPPHRRSRSRGRAPLPPTLRSRSRGRSARRP